MYTIIKGVNDYVGGKLATDSSGVGLLLQNNLSYSIFPDQRNVLIDFTVKDNCTDVIDSEKGVYSKCHNNYQSGVEKIVKTENCKLDCTNDRPMSSIDCLGKEKNSAYSQRINLACKDDPTNFSVLTRTKVKDNTHIDQHLQFDNGRGLLFDENLRDMFSTSLIRKDLGSDHILLKEFENDSLLESDSRLALSTDRSYLNNQNVLLQERNSIKCHEVPLLSSQNLLQGQNNCKISHSISMENNPNLGKQPALSPTKLHERSQFRTESSGVVNQQMREIHKHSSEIQFHDQIGTKLASSIIFPPDSACISDSLSITEISDQISSSIPANQQILIGTPSNSFTVQQKIQVKNTISVSIPEKNLGVNGSPSLMQHEEMRLNEALSSFEASSNQIRINNTPLSLIHDHYKIKSPSDLITHSFPSNQPISKPSSSVVLTLEEDAVKNNAQQESQINQKLSSVMANSEKIKNSSFSPTFVQESINMKSISSSPQNQVIGSKESSHFNMELDAVGLRRNLSQSSVVQLQLPLKNLPPYLENALNYYNEEENIIKKAALEPSVRSIIQDSTVGKDSGSSSILSKNVIIDKKVKNSFSPVTNQSKLLNPIFSDDNKIRNYCFPIYDENCKQSSYQQKPARETNFQPEEDEVLDFRLKDVQSSCHSSLPSYLIDDSQNNSALRYFKAGQNILRSVSDPYGLSESFKEKEILQNQPSVIAQVGQSCKVCNCCRNFYFENGFLNQDDSCALCLFHAENDMKCVCYLQDIKDKNCTCVEKKYRCSYCYETFPTILLLQRHTFNHVSDEDRRKVADKRNNEYCYICVVCNASFTTSISLDHHMNSHKEIYCVNCNRTFKQFNAARHSCEARYICNLCGASFASNYNLKMHLLKHTGCLPYKCRECNKSFAKPSELSKHSLVHSGERPYSCDECNMSFTSSTYLRSHKATHSGRKPHSCQICHKSFTRPADVKRHLLIHTGVRPYACEVCGLAFTDASNMRKHMSTHSKPQQGADIKTYHCTHCGKMFARPSELKRHFFTHTNTRPYACHICGLAFTDSSNLKKHIQTHERSSEHLCLQCDTSFNTFSELEMHVTSSHGAKRFDSASGHTCQTCGAAFVQLVDLQDHVLSHGATSIYRCDVCSKNFCEQIFLERHLLTHTESRPYVCNECSKSFKSLSHLRSHILIHSGEKSHICLKCNKSFLKKSSLLRHQGVHDKEKVPSKFQYV